MNILRFNDVKILSNLEISKEIFRIEKKLFNLKLKKTTRQLFKSHDIKNAKRYLIQLRSILTLRLNYLEQKKTNSIRNLIKYRNHLNES